MPNTRHATLAVVVPATDRPPTLGRILAALGESTDLPDELVVVEDPPGGSPAAARNAGARHTTSELIAFVDADVAVERRALEILRGRLDRDPTLDAVFGSYDDRPAARGVVSRFRNLLHHHVHQSSPGPAETFWAGLGVVRRGAFERVGGFDADRFAQASVEDIELGMRLRERGSRIELDPAARGTHLKRWSLGSMIDTDLRRRGIPWTRVQLERRNLGNGLNLQPRHRASALAAAGVPVAVLTRHLRSAAALVGAVIALELPFLRLLGRTGGPSLAVAGVALQIVHGITAVAAVIAGTALHLLGRAERRR